MEKETIMFLDAMHQGLTISDNNGNLVYINDSAAEYFGINKKLLPRKTAFWVTVLVVVMIYYILRNFIPILDIPKLC